MSDILNELSRAADNLLAIRNDVYERERDFSHRIIYHVEWHEKSDALLKECIGILHASPVEHIIALVDKIKEHLKGKD